MMDVENGPRPMKNMKPSEKKPNSADQFWEDHNPNYENHGKTSNSVDSVQNHNATYPKMKEELDKRRSIAQCRPEEQQKGCYARPSREV